MSPKLYQKLIKYKDEDYYPFHMPGHKRNMNKMQKILGNISAYEYDITEIEGFDDFHNTSGVIADILKEVSDFYGSNSSYFLVNGSTCGILAAISAVLGNNITTDKKIVLARNSHKSAYNAVMLENADVRYVYPDIIEGYNIQGGINPKEVEEILKKETNVSAVFITSPTYEGIVSDIKMISEIAHKYKVPLIVDEAHGAHFGMYKDFPESALSKGADIVIQSLHKTLPSLTQTAILHISKGSLVEKREIERYLSVYQSSSPSYVLLSSMDVCLSEIISKGDRLFEDWKNKIYKFQCQCKNLTNVEVLNKEIVGNHNILDFDISKLVIIPKSKSISGFELLKKLLYDYKIQVEMATADYIIAMTSIMDENEGFERLFKALKEIDDVMDMTENADEIEPMNIEKTTALMKIKEAIYSKGQLYSLEEVEGKISKEFIFLYPPGVPIVVPGEIITKKVLETIINYKKIGLNVVGLKGKYCDKIEAINKLKKE